MDLQELKNTYAIEHAYKDWKELQEYHKYNPRGIEDHMNEICIRAQKAALEKAAISAVIGRVSCGDCNCMPTFYCRENNGIIKESITNPDNLIQ